MTSKVILKRSSVPARVPVSGDLDYGELALNYADEKLYFKNTSNVIKSFNISGGVGGQSAFDFQTYTASAAQTTFAVTYTAPYVNVYVNGVRQSGADYTATSGSSVVLAVAANAGDIINLVGFNSSFSLTAAGYGDSLNPYASKTANTVLAAPNGSAGAPSFRALVAADIPTLNQNTTGTASNVTGIVAVANGGTGTATPGLVAGTNVTVTGSWPNQTINASGGGGGGSSALTISNKTGAYTVVAGDVGTIINCTSGTFTVSLTAAATLGAGFNCWILNTGSGTITINPNGSELVDGNADSLILKQGAGYRIVCDGTNFNIIATKTSGGMNVGAFGVQLGNGATVANGNSVAIGENAFVSSSFSSVAIGKGTNAGANWSTSIGTNSNQQGSSAVTGAGAMALGGSYASGVDSFAAGVANNTSSFGATGTNSIALGQNARAVSTNSIAIGSNANSTAGAGIAIGPLANSSNSNIVISLSALRGAGSTASSNGGCIAIGGNNTASAFSSVAIGQDAISADAGKFVFSPVRLAVDGDAQTGTKVISASTTDATAKALSVGDFGPTFQLILPNNSAYAFTGIIVARRKASEGTASAAWQVTGLIRREGSAATTVLVDWAMTTINNTPGWTLALTADTTNGGLAVTATGAAATNIRWVATLQTSEVTYA